MHTQVLGRSSSVVIESGAKPRNRGAFAVLGHDPRVVRRAGGDRLELEDLAGDVCSAGVNVVSSMLTTVSGPAKNVRARVGPRPKRSLYSRTISLDTARATECCSSGA